MPPLVVESSNGRVTRVEQKPTKQSKKKTSIFNHHIRKKKKKKKRKFYKWEKSTDV